MAGPDDPPGGRRQYYVPAPGDESSPARPPGPSVGAGPAGASAPAAPSADRVRAAYGANAAADGPSGPPPGPSRPAPSPERAPRARTGRSSSRLRRWFTPKWRWLYLYLPLLIVALIAGTLYWAYDQFDGIQRIDLGSAIAPATGTTVNYLLVGSDSRAGITDATPNSGAIGPGVAGSRSDTIIVLRTNGSTAQMMSVPRDLWATNAQTGQNGKINGAYNQGPANLVRTVTKNLGIPINHYMEVNFVSFSGIVDAMGGITINFPNPAYDKNSGLNIIASGPVKLNGTQALAYVRSRHYVAIIDGQPTPDPTADIGREQRQQNFIRTVLHDVGQTRNPFTLAQIASAGTKGMKVDTELGFGDAFSLVRNLAGASPKTVVLPTSPVRKGRESALELQRVAATPVLAQFGGAPNTPK